MNYRIRIISKILYLIYEMIFLYPLFPESTQSISYSFSMLYSDTFCHLFASVQSSSTPLPHRTQQKPDKSLDGQLINLSEPYYNRYSY